MLSAVATRGDQRLLSAVLEHAPDHEDIRALLPRRTTALTARDVTLVGLTTDGSALSPVPLAEVVGGVPPPRCAFHLVADGVKAVLGAVASERQRLAATPPPLPQGRPSTQAAQAAARQKKRLAEKRGDVYTHRHLCVQPPLSRSEPKRWWRLTRGLPRWRTRRAILEHVSALFDRRGRTQPALDQWDTRRRRLLRFTQWGETLKKLLSPPLEKARTFLDAKLLPATSHAVERGNRR